MGMSRDRPVPSELGSARRRTAPAWRGGFGQGAIEALPSRHYLALHNFQCADCGPIKTKIISLVPKTDLRPGDVSDFDQTATA